MIISRTPLRVSFFGGGTDYPAWLQEHSGAVLATTIDKYIYVTCRHLPPIFPHTIRVSYSKTEHVAGVDQVEHPAVRECLRFLGIGSHVEIHTDADLPARTGLGSSSCFTVGLLHVLHAYQGSLVTKQQLAQEAIHVEQNLIQENVGCQDQVLASWGGLNRIDFDSRCGFRVVPIPLSQERQEGLERQVMLFYTGRSRIASEIVTEQLSRIREKEKALSRIFTMVEEGVSLLSGKGDWRDFGELMHEGWMLKQSLSSRIATPEVTQAYATAREKGAFGGKLLGAGGGGFLLIFAPPEVQEAIRAALAPLPWIPVKFESAGSHLIFYQPNHRPLPSLP